jgi:hypothetical protein
MVALQTVALPFVAILCALGIMGLIGEQLEKRGVWEKLGVETKAVDIT